MAKKSKRQPQQLSPERFIRERGRSIPVEKCYLDLESIKEYGEGQAVIVRQHKGGKRTVGAYLIDAWCRGVRDAFYVALMEDDEYRGFMDRLLGNPAQHLEKVPYGISEESMIRDSRLTRYYNSYHPLNGILEQTL